MSKLVESLQSQMRAIFGDSFGQAPKPIVNLTEAVETALLERKGGKPKGKSSPAFSRGGDFGADVKSRIGAQAGRSAPARSKKAAAQDAARAREKKASGRIKRNAAAFQKQPDKGGEKSAQRSRSSKPDVKKGGDAGTSRKVVSKAASGGGGSGQHNPFKHSPNLGTGPGTPPGFHPVHGKRHHDERKCWNCKCGNVYDKGCECVGTGKTKDCPKGHTKHVQIHKAYRHAYNDMYHAWQRGEGKHSKRKGKWQGPRR